MANGDGSSKIIGEWGVTKHEKKSHDCRMSNTMVRTGAFGGSNGPTVFLMKGERIKTGYTAEFLIRHGCRIGSQILMTENACMTEDCFVKMTPKLVDGYRKMPFIAENPDWWALEIFDGFGPHYSSLEAMKYRFDHKIRSAKKEGHSSSTNQVRQFCVNEFVTHRGTHTLSLLFIQQRCLGGWKVCGKVRQKRATKNLCHSLPHEAQ